MRDTGEEEKEKNGKSQHMLRERTILNNQLA